MKKIKKYIKVTLSIIFRKYEKTVLVLRVDGIGDYMLMRNFIRELKSSEKFSGYKIALVVRSEYAELAKYLDGDTVDEFIIVNFNRFFKSFRYRFMFLLRLRFFRPEFVLSPAFMPDEGLCLPILISIGAKNKIGWKASMIRFSEKGKDKKSYYKALTETFDPEDKIMFEFDRNRDFFERVTDKKISLETPSISYRKTNPLKIACFVPYTWERYRNWNEEYSAEVIDWLIERYGYQVMLLGKENGDWYSKLVGMLKNKENCHNLAGTQTLRGVVELMKSAKINISMDTGLAHISASLHVPTVIISCGSSEILFHPYPGRADVISVYPDRRPAPVKTITNMSYEKSLKLGYNVNKVSPGDVKSAIDKMISEF